MICKFNVLGLTISNWYVRLTIFQRTYWYVKWIFNTMFLKALNFFYMIFNTIQCVQSNYFLFTVNKL